MPKTFYDDTSIVGEECHIISRKPNGPRCHKILQPREYDQFENLLLLCRVHHKLVDDQENTYTIEYLTEIKRMHEKWVSASLSSNSQNENASFAILPRILTGKQLMASYAGCLAFSFDNDEPQTDTEMRSISSFHQQVQDWGDCWDGIDSGERVEAGYSLSKRIIDLDRIGFWVFGSRQTRKLQIMGKPGVDKSEEWPIFVMTVVRHTNAGITPLGDLASIIIEA
jgi:hypothetical protein